MSKSGSANSAGTAFFDAENCGGLKMKKIISIIIALVLVLSFAACSNETADNSSSENEEQSSQQSEEEPSEEGKTYTIGICQLVQHEALDAATQGFKDALNELLAEGGNSVVFIEHNASGDAPTCTTICNMLVSDKVDLILANATAALQAAAAATNEIPVIGTSITDYATALEVDNWTGKTGTNITGTSDLAPLEQQAAMIKELFPDAETVGILYCSGEPNSVYQADIVKAELEGMGYTCEIFTFVDTNDLASVTTSACNASDVIYIPTDNTAANCTETINNVALPAGVPIVAGEAGICRGCGVATLSISYYDIGYAAGEMAAEILKDGKNPGDMEIGFAPEVVKMYNPEICSSLGITPPEGYEALS